MRQSTYRKKETKALALALRFCKFSSFTERYGTNLDHPPLREKDVAALQRCLHVVPGRYWVLADGIGGPEGSPPQLNLAALCGAKGGGGSSMKCEDHINGQFNCSG